MVYARLAIFVSQSHNQVKFDLENYCSYYLGNFNDQTSSFGKSESYLSIAIKSFHAIFDAELLLNLPQFIG